MTGTREEAVAQAGRFFDQGGFAAGLTRLVAAATQSQIDNAHPALQNYFAQLIGPELKEMGFKFEILDNPEPAAGPLLFAERHEGDALPTILIYGHGDVVVGQDDRWRDDLSPWVLTTDGDRLYGRGTADNKGQHWVNISALRTVLTERGDLGFNCKILLESDEEMGSRGLRAFCDQERKRLAADVLIASDGPRLDPERATVVLGSRGLVNFEMAVNLRDGAHHSGNWGGLIKDPGIILAHALASLTDGRGQIAVPEWRPTTLTDDLRTLLADLTVSGGPNAPAIDADWGEADLSPEERVFGWNSFAVLALEQGDPERPQNAIQPSARAACQLRYVVGTDPDDLLPALRRHLDAHGFGDVEIAATRMAGMRATRLDPGDPWAQLALKSLSQTLGKPAALVPNIGGSIPNDIFAELLGLSTVWVPHSYAGCAQHAPNEHMLASVAREGLQVMTGLFWDIGDVSPGPDAS
ncbi:MAG: M20/M25/M40 family metallo-hydrolase [Alphaproteobacteria bacterium]|nr:M20/M25/M40 family metallo-hydrolase [Alphaproteobacteria bacterium]